MYMKKTLVAAAVLLSLQLAAQPLPRITVIATGGTIAGTAGRGDYAPGVT